MTPAYFAHNEYKDYIIYNDLARREKNPEFKKILENLTEHELKHFEFWRGLSEKKEFHVGMSEILFMRFLRLIFGLTFIARLLERQEREAVREYTTLLPSLTPENQEKVREIIMHEETHESELINHIKEDKVQFIGNVTLGLNDGLIELTGALVGFSFALGNHNLVVLSGFITGIAATLSMASSAYLQARVDPTRNAKKAALYTGIPYLIVVILLVTPFIIISHTYTSIGVMFVIAMIIIASLSYYNSILFERNFKREFGTIFALSIGVAIITFALGSLFRHFFGTAL